MRVRFRFLRLLWQIIEIENEEGEHEDVFAVALDEEGDNESEKRILIRKLSLDLFISLVF